MNSFEVLLMILHMLLFAFYCMVKFILKTQVYAPVFFSQVILLYMYYSIELTKVRKKVKKFLVKIQVSGIFQQHSK